MPALLAAILPSIIPFILTKAKSKKPVGLTETAYTGVYFASTSIYESVKDCGLTADCFASVDINQWGALASAVTMAGIRIYQKYKEQ